MAGQSIAIPTKPQPEEHHEHTKQDDSLGDEMDLAFTKGYAAAVGDIATALSTNTALANTLVDHLELKLGRKLRALDRADYLAGAPISQLAAAAGFAVVAVEVLGHTRTCRFKSLADHMDIRQMAFVDPVFPEQMMSEIRDRLSGAPQ